MNRQLRPSGRQNPTLPATIAYRQFLKNGQRKGNRKRQGNWKKSIM